MSLIGCNCSKGKTFVVNLPGQGQRRVSTEAAAKALTTGVAGASYSVVAK